MKTIVISLLKGGVGKTFFATHLAWYLAEPEGRRIAFIDLDPQGSSTRRLAKELTGLLSADLFDPEAAMDIDSKPGITVFGADQRLQMVKAAEDVRDFIVGFPKLEGHFDYCVIDTGPKWDELTLSAMAVADEVIAPVQVAEDSLECAKMLLTALKKAEGARGGRKVNFLGLLPSMVNAFDKREMENVVKLTQAVGPAMMFPAFVKARPTYKHSAENHHAVWNEKGSGAKAAAEEIRTILAEVERRVGARKKEAA
ncbi:chromosome partitioning protein [Sphingobium sp. AP50]|uniref:ParA family protein n=1 Tax=Sphingobium sp. AP50 TaxID=1884369 RepID=UPI0008D6CE7F|nr:ParA family protein [Sphingobium sp. AP50]SEJ80685.1 chromosome partitioning protein [Sphingobium sp. AP50]